MTTSTSAAPAYFESESHAEARARLDYLVDSGHRLGVLFGPRGSGKSLTLSHACQAWKRTNAGVALLDAAGLEVDPFLSQLASDWKNGAPIDAARVRLWQAVVDALSVQHCERRASILLVDNAGHATYEVLDALHRLTGVADSRAARLTMILAVESARLSHLGADLLDRADLRVELGPLGVHETLGYVQLQQLPPEKVQFPADVTQRMHALTAGLPRRLNRLAELVALAAESDGHTEVDVATVDAVYRELCAPAWRRGRD